MAGRELPSAAGEADRSINSYTMNRKIFLIVLLLLVPPASFAAGENISDRVEVGQTREQITHELGRPHKIEMLKKESRPIWGPEEEFWDEIPEGTMLEVWRYISPEGRLNLYFMNGGDALAYKAFAPKGVVYESGK